MSISPWRLERQTPIQWALSIGAGVVIATGLLASPANAQDSVVLKRVFTAGETDRYTTTIKFEQSAMEAVLVTTEVTREVKDDGSAVVATTVDSIVLRGRGSEVPFPGGSGQVLLSTYDKTGKLVKQETVGGGGDVGMLLNVARPSVFLEKPLKVGESITDEVAVGPDKSRKVVVSVTLLSIDRKSADLPEDCLRFKVVSERTVPGPAGDVKSKSEVTVRLGKENGKLVSAEGKMDGIPMPGGGLTKLSYTVTRTPAKR